MYESKMIFSESNTLRSYVRVLRMLSRQIQHNFVNEMLESTVGLSLIGVFCGHRVLLDSNLSIL